MKIVGENWEMRSSSKSLIASSSLSVTITTLLKGPSSGVPGRIKPVLHPKLALCNMKP
ncbi:uncharacterized protein DS421_16g569040 [Arachis hypogaea]|nr:uncharacterized protein DS421_16g569040 [Arachis hypogaea]